MATMYIGTECERCGIAASDLSDGVDPESMFERSSVTGEILCQACLSEIDFEPGWVDLEP
ncbi:hypothetical protein GS534_24525 [Rhodococcus hoagii]|nr:hypothetical protein [Prescottella equi]MBM4617903.1 hypothetical protein [Prescottella equi]NKS33196.1 hypothetical protein [Prescottella equi]